MSVEKILWLSTWVFIALPIPIFLLGWPNLAIWISPVCFLPMGWLFDEWSSKRNPKEFDIPDNHIVDPNADGKMISSFILFFPYAAIIISTGDLLFLTPDTPWTADVVQLLLIVGSILGIYLLYFILEFYEWVENAFNKLRRKEQKK